MELQCLIINASRLKCRSHKDERSAFERRRFRRSAWLVATEFVIQLLNSCILICWISFRWVTGRRRGLSVIMRRVASVAGVVWCRVCISLHFKNSSVDVAGTCSGHVWSQRNHIGLWDLTQELPSRATPTRKSRELSKCWLLGCRPYVSFQQTHSTTIGSSFCPLYTSYFTYLASSASLRTNV